MILHLAACPISGGQYISSTLPYLDHIVAFDHTVPEFWGWHVDREALAALERIHFQAYRQFYIDENGFNCEHSWDVYLISVGPEYNRYSQHYHDRQQDGADSVERVPPITLQVSVEWLKTQLQARWSSVAFDVRHDSQAYRLNWLIEIDGFNLIGGLHRDGYAVVITGNSEAIYQFVQWYRRITPDYELYFYEWASPGIRLQSNMSLKQIREAMSTQYVLFDKELKQSK